MRTPFIKKTSSSAYLNVSSYILSSKENKLVFREQFY